VRIFAVERIRHLALTDDRFTVRPDFDFAAYTRDAFGLMRDEAVTVRVRFRRDQAKYVRERLWHPSQHLEDHADGSLTLTPLGPAAQKGPDARRRPMRIPQSAMVWSPRRAAPAPMPPCAPAALRRVPASPRRRAAPPPPPRSPAGH